MKQSIYQSSYCDAYYEDEKNVVLVCWKSYCELEQYRTPLEYAVYEWWCRDNALTALKRDSFITILKTNEARFDISYDFNVLNDQGKRVRGFKGVNTCYKVRASIAV